MDVFQAALIVTLRSQELILSCLKDAMLIGIIVVA